ncbi:MAG: hypothetical protein WBN75_17845 [Verrucomicrobiia bacterium]|jgi:hypothetical protein
MTDSEIITKAYENTIQQLFSVLFDSSVVAKTPADQSQAEQQFQAGVRKAREVRDKAIALVS